ncbi:uncharacterized protein Dwil_GK18883 [Drosophila willistoni]|uniref:DUF7775 domain-containing protein n=1 Tax=Drosophila willistoni TaxID=7260 RepID=B4N5Q6_DROWI|nr:uncharacterized protein LOC6646269 [Drosophila willistoni]EDW79695.1 uncharacterized protein Dwil_GK18883 [Drosophila willistoni]
MRPILFLFYTVETVINMFLMAFHIRGFMSVDLGFLPLYAQLTHLFYAVIFYIFTVMTMFCSINICTGHQSNLVEEILRTAIGSLMYVIISMMTLNDAEEDFHLMYVGMGDPNLPEKPIHPFFAYLKTQAICALANGVVYLLHCIITIDVLLSNEEDTDGEYHLYDTSDEYDEDSDYVPVRLYVFGEGVHDYLERYEWFRNFCHTNRMSI